MKCFDKAYRDINANCKEKSHYSSQIREFCFLSQRKHSSLVFQNPITELAVMPNSLPPCRMLEKCCVERATPQTYPTRLIQYTVIGIMYSNYKNTYKSVCICLQLINSKETHCFFVSRVPNGHERKVF